MLLVFSGLASSFMLARSGSTSCTVLEGCHPYIKCLRDDIETERKPGMADVVHIVPNELDESRCEPMVYLRLLPCVLPSKWRILPTLM